jgi:ribonuclease HI
LACLKCLGIVWELNYRHIFLKSHSVLTVKYIGTAIPLEGVRRNLVALCQEFLKRDWEVRVRHIYREANQVADFLAEKAFSLPIDYTFFVTPPDWGE